MQRATSLVFIAMIAVSSLVTAADPLRGTYVEARTCQVYTGPCFANGEVGSTGKDAIMTWKIDKGQFSGVELAGKSVALIVKASNTLGFNGLADAQTKRAVLVVDASADEAQSAALKSFALAQTGFDERELASEHSAAIDMQFDISKLTASVDVGKIAKLVTRKARPGDCICSNESAYYPPLTQLKGFVPGVAEEGDVTVRSLGSRWSIPGNRSAYLGTFEVDASSPASLAKTF